MITLNDLMKEILPYLRERAYENAEPRCKLKRDQLLCLTYRLDLGLLYIGLQDNLMHWPSHTVFAVAAQDKESHS